MKCSFCIAESTVTGNDFTGANKSACPVHQKNLTTFRALPTNMELFTGAVQAHASTPAPTVNEPGPGPESIALRPFTGI